MNVSKTLASTVAAMAVVGSVGFAYAQTTSSDPASTNNNTSSQTMDSNNRSLSSPSTMNNDPLTNNSTLSSEPAPQADRG